MAGISYVKGIRDEGKKFSLNELIFTGILGAAGVLLVYCFSKEIRQDDKLAHRKVLWLNILFLSIHIVIIFLLFYFKVIDSSTSDTSSLIHLI